MTAPAQRSDDLIRTLEARAREIREKTIRLGVQSGSTHFGGSLSMVDILVVLYFHVLRIDPQHPDWEDRDRFILSKGHGATSYCPVLSTAGFFPASKMDDINHLGSAFGMHIDMRKIPGVDMSTGSLGHGLPVAVGMALADRVRKKSRRVFCLMGDAEQNEGSIWEAAQAAGHFKLGRLCAIVDRNRYSSEGDTEEILAIEPLHEKYAAFGWNVRRLDGHSIPALLDAFAALPGEDRAKPTAIIADTVKGKGVSFMEAGATWHYGALSEEDEARALADIRGSAADGGGNRPR
jgi:transketolase